MDASAKYRQERTLCAMLFEARHKSIAHKVHSCRGHG